MRSWFRTVTGPTSPLLTLLGLVLVFDLGLNVLLRFAAKSNEPTGYHLWMYGTPYLFAVVYGFARVLRLHPFLQPEYRTWLRGTPWTPGKELPNGPVHLVPQDLALVAAIGLLGFFYGPRTFVLTQLYFPPLMTLFTFGMAYLLAVAFTCFFTGVRRHGYALLSAAVLVLYFLFQPFIAIPLLLVGLTLTWPALTGSLRDFPWLQPDGSEPVNPLGMYADELFLGTEGPRIGWPFGGLSPKCSYPGTTTEDGAWTGLLMGGLYLSCDNMLQRIGGHLHEVGFFFWVPILVALVIRWRVYWHDCSMPISIPGRLFTGRLVVPGWDVSLLAPVSAVLIGHLVPKLLVRAGAAENISYASGLAIAMMILVSGGPKVRDWKLTGTMRLVAPRSSVGATQRPAR